MTVLRKTAGCMPPEVLRENQTMRSTLSRNLLLKRYSGCFCSSLTSSIKLNSTGLDMQSYLECQSLPLKARIKSPAKEVLSLKKAEDTITSCLHCMLPIGSSQMLLSQNNPSMVHYLSLHLWASCFTAKGIWWTLKTKSHQHFSEECVTITKITEQFMLEGTLKTIWFQPPCHGRDPFR